MNDYTIYCTEEQTKKALELGAPIDFFEENDEHNEHAVHVGQGLYAVIPTAEQMMAWLEEQDKICSIEITLYECYWQYIVRTFNRDEDVWNDEFDAYLTRKEATIAAIDAALDYLTNQKSK